MTGPPYGWRPLLILSAIAVVDQVGANLTSGLLPILQAEFGMTDTLAGALEAAEAGATVLVLLPAGYLADRRNRTGLISLALSATAILALGAAFAGGLIMLYGLRVLWAAASSSQGPAASSLLGDYYPSRHRSTAYGYHRMAYFAGGSLGVVLGGVAGQALGWRGALLLMVLPAVVVAVLAGRMVEPARAGVQTPRFLPQIREILRSRAVVRTYAALTALFIGVGGFGFWEVTYFVRTFGLSPGQAAALVPIVDLVGIVTGTIAGAWIGDRWSAAISGWRSIVSSAGLIAGSAVLAAALLAPGPVFQVAVFTFAAFLLSTAIPNLNAAVADLLPDRSRGTGFALLELLLTAGAATGPAVTGIVSDSAGSLAAGFAAMAAIMILGGLLLAPRHTD